MISSRYSHRSLEVYCGTSRNDLEAQRSGVRLSLLQVQWSLDEGYSKHCMYTGGLGDEGPPFFQHPLWLKNGFFIRSLLSCLVDGSEASPAT